MPLAFNFHLATFTAILLEFLLPFGSGDRCLLGNFVAQIFGSAHASVQIFGQVQLRFRFHSMNRPALSYAIHL